MEEEGYRLYAPNDNDPWKDLPPPYEWRQQLHTDARSMPYASDESVSVLAEHRVVNGTDIEQFVVMLHYPYNRVRALVGRVAAVENIAYFVPATDNESLPSLLQNLFRLEKLHNALSHGMADHEPPEMVYTKRWLVRQWAIACFETLYGKSIRHSANSGIIESLIKWGQRTRKGAALAPANLFFSTWERQHEFLPGALPWIMHMIGHQGSHMPMTRRAIEQLFVHEQYPGQRYPACMFRPLWRGLRFAMVVDNDLPVLSIPVQQGDNALDLLQRAYSRMCWEHVLVCYIDSEGYVVTRYTGSYAAYRLPFSRVFYNAGSEKENTQFIPKL